MKALPAVILLLLCAIPVQVRAEETPQTMAAELRFGQYGPSIDSEFTGDVSPFWDSFGNESAWLFGGELDYQLWHGFGSVGLFAGGSWGYVSGKGLEADGGESSDSTTLSLAPVAVGAVYRFDVLARRLGIPLVGAFKGGVAYTFWWIRDGVEEIASFETEDMVMDGYGGTWGCTGASGCTCCWISSSLTRRRCSTMRWG